MPWEAFFYGLEQPAEELSECIRIHTAMNPRQIERGIGIIADTVKKLYEG